MAGKVLVPKELGKPLGMYSHGVVAPGGELIVVAGQGGVDAAGRRAGGTTGWEYIPSGLPSSFGTSTFPAIRPSSPSALLPYPISQG